MTGSLIHNGDNDYTLRDGETSCWITVDNVSVYVFRSQQGVSAELFAKGCEMENSISYGYVPFHEAQETIDDYESATRDQRRGAPAACGLSDPGSGNQEAGVEE